MIERHDILRTGGAVGRAARAGASGVAQARRWRSKELTSGRGVRAMSRSSLRERFDPRRYRLDVSQAPLMRLFVAHDSAEGALGGDAC